MYTCIFKVLSHQSYSDCTHNHNPQKLIKIVSVCVAHCFKMWAATILVLSRASLCSFVLGPIPTTLLLAVWDALMWYTQDLWTWRAPVLGPSSRNSCASVSKHPPMRGELLKKWPMADVQSSLHPACLVSSLLGPSSVCVMASTQQQFFLKRCSVKKSKIVISFREKKVKVFIHQCLTCDVMLWYKMCSLKLCHAWILILTGLESSKWAQANTYKVTLIRPASPFEGSKPTLLLCISAFALSAVESCDPEKKALASSSWAQGSSVSAAHRSDSQPEIPIYQCSYIVDH